MERWFEISDLRLTIDAGNGFHEARKEKMADEVQLLRKFLQESRSFVAASRQSGANSRRLMSAAFCRKRPRLVCGDFFQDESFYCEPAKEFVAAEEIGTTFGSLSGNQRALRAKTRRAGIVVENVTENPKLRQERHNQDIPPQWGWILGRCRYYKDAAPAALRRQNHCRQTDKAGIRSCL
jgi:hypothetical protein